MSPRPCWCTDQQRKKSLLGIWVYYYAKLEWHFAIVWYTNMAVSSREWKRRIKIFHTCTRDNVLFRSFLSKCGRKESMCFVSIRTRTYSMEVKVIWFIVFNLRCIVFDKHMRNFLIPTVPWHTFTDHFEQSNHHTSRYMYGNDSLLRRMKGICHVWSRDRDFSPSLPAWRQVSEIWFQNRSPDQNLGKHLSVCPEVLCSLSFFMYIMCSGYSFSVHTCNLFHPFKKLKNGNFPFFSKSCQFCFVFLFLLFSSFFFLH